MKHTPSTQPVALIEIPKGSRNKYEYDEGFGRVMLDRTLRSSLVYPCDYGFILDTLGGDGDPLDVLVLVASPTFPGCLIPCDPIGVLQMRDEAGDDPKILAVPHDDPVWTRVNELEGVRTELLDEIAHFFDVYKDLEPGKTVVVNGWQGRLEAEQLVAEARTAFTERAAARAAAES